jgi:hypothetical protein
VKGAMLEDSLALVKKKYPVISRKCQGILAKGREEK